MITIKRYPNRKLYDTQARQYISLEGVAKLIRQGSEVQVIDNASGEDLTALTLTQIIMEQERRRSGLLSDIFLAGLIRSGGDHSPTFQRSQFIFPIFQRRVDAEIERRLQTLVDAGELTDLERKKLLEKMLSPTARLAPIPCPDAQIEALVTEFCIPTRDDFQKLNEQLDELTARLVEIRPVDHHWTD